jgi:hypothetical protein
MPDDDLQARLRDADPALRTPSPDSVWIDTLAQSTMEAPMNVPEPAAGTRRTWLLTAAAAVVVAALGFGGWTALQGDDNRGGQVAQEKTVMTLKAPAAQAGGPAAMCMRLEPTTVGQMQVAFDGTVASVDDDTVTLDVNKWYAGGDTDQVALTQISQAEWVALEGGITLEAGQRYLVTAHDGVVNGCGFTAPWSQELQDIFDQGFAS